MPIRQPPGRQPADDARVVSFSWLAASLLLLTGGIAPAQVSPDIGTVGEFTAAGENYGPPHEQQPRWRLSGREAELLEGGRYRLRQVQLEFFRATGEREALLAAPECIHDAANSRAYSSGPLHIESGDGRAAIEGEGFRWEQPAATLLISNGVRATLQRVVTNPPPAPLVISSRWFLFEITNRRAVFHEQVRGEDAEIEFTCAQLAVQSTGTNATFDAVEAQGGLAVLEKATGRRVTAARAIYSRAEERAQLLGDVVWSQPDQSGQADRLEFDRASGSVRAEGRVTLRLPPGTFGLSAVAGDGSNAAALQLTADSVFSHTNLVVAEGRVRLQSGTNGLTCEKLTARLDADRRNVETALAEGDVRVLRAAGTLRAEAAEFSQAAGRVVFRGKPEWSDARSRGRARRLTVQTETGNLLAEEEVNVTLVLSGQSGSLPSVFPETTRTNGEPRIVQVFAQSLLTDPARAVFGGGVRAHQAPLTGSEPRLQCDTLTLEFAGGDGAPAPGAAGRLQAIHARGHVLCEQGQPGVTNGPAIYRRLGAQTLSARADPTSGAWASLLAEGDVVLEHPGSRATGGRAVYEADSGVLELRENPTLETPEVLIGGARALRWDRTRGTYAMSGPFKARIKAETARQLAEKIQSP